MLCQLPPVLAIAYSLANLWVELAAPIPTLREAAQLLHEDGRLILIELQAHAEWPHARIAFE